MLRVPSVLSKTRNFIQEEVSKKLRAWNFNFLPQPAGIFSPDRCCLSIDRGKILLVQARKDNQAIELRQKEVYEYSQPKDIKAILSQLVQAQGLQGVRCTLMLRPEQYQLLQTEALPVPPSEFQHAIRWKAKDMLRFPIDDALIDSFEVPAGKLAAAQQSIMLVVARLSQIRPLCDQINASGLRLMTIDIPELSFRNLTARYEEDEKGSALIYMQEADSQLIITSQKKLYLNRRLNVGAQDLAAAKDKDDLNQVANQAALEIQRTFDYYQSQWRQTEPGRIFIANAVPSSVDLAALLSPYLNLSVSKLDIKNYFSLGKPLNLEQEGYFLPLLGGLLREWEQEYATRN